MSLLDRITSLTWDKIYRIDTMGRSGSTVYIYDDMVLKEEPDSESVRESVKVMEWLEGKLPVPRVICHEIADGKSYLLMSRINGIMACDRYYRERSYELVKLLAEGLRMLWSVDIAGCPGERTLDDELAYARYRVENGLVDTAIAEPGTFDELGYTDPNHLLKWLEANKPSYEPVLSHGDFCLPNIFIDEGRISGFIDLGDMAIGDKWRDISLCYRSLKHNYDGTFGHKVYPCFGADALFDELGIEPDFNKIRYYIMLDELF
jgi:kanamycin kinase/aminoglycoside 3'-phosphotransferase-3